MRSFKAFLCALSASLVAGQASAITLTFDDIDLQHGSVISDQYAGVEITAVNFHKSFGIASGFNTELTGTRDPDLESSLSGGIWSGGNLQGTELGFAMIIQENDESCSTGVCSAPDDEGWRPAGEFIFDFSSPASSFGFDFIDLDDETLEAGMVTFFSGGMSAIVEFTSLAAGLTIGDNTANRFAATTAASVGLMNFESVVITLGGSGAVDNVTYQPVPEPTTFLLFSTAAAMVVVRRRMQASA